MNDIIWGSKTPDSDIIEIDENTIIYAMIPDWVKLPPELGGYTVAVLSTFINHCPKCSRQVKHLELENNYFVSECPEHKYLWYKI